MSKSKEIPDNEQNDAQKISTPNGEFEKLREEYRNRIDELDEKILANLNERAMCAIDVGVIKKQHGQRLFDPQRENRVLNRLVEINDGPLTKEAVLRLFERIIDESRRVERIEVYDKE